MSAGKAVAGGERLGFAGGRGHVIFGLADGLVVIPITDLEGGGVESTIKYA